MKESDLYPPLKEFLEAQSYCVKSEIKHCDVMATRDNEEPVIIELKLSINLTVILQAVDRLALSPKVYIGIPKGCKTLTKQRKRILKLLRLLGLGLIVIDTREVKENVKVIVDPKEYQPRQSKIRQARLLGEFAKRVGDPNLGGMQTNQGVITAYRQQALNIASYLKIHGPTKAAAIALTLDEPKARNILYKNVYGWFENTAYGVYGLSPQGIKDTGAAKPAST